MIHCRQACLHSNYQVDRSPILCTQSRARFSAKKVLKIERIHALATLAL